LCGDFVRLGLRRVAELEPHDATNRLIMLWWTLNDLAIDTTGLPRLAPGKGSDTTPTAES
jgi:hypothetical protein